MKRAQLTKRIPLTQGQFAIVDLVDYVRIAIYHWILLQQSYHKTKRPKSKAKYYAYRWTLSNDGKYVRVFLHHEILGHRVRVDHRDGNGLNNTRDNLGVATSVQNSHNRRKSSGCSSIYKGVCWHTHLHKWQAEICIGRDEATRSRKKLYLGWFDSEKDAARAYDAVALRHFGEFALLNFPQSRRTALRR